jgi:hypothetical protein
MADGATRWVGWCRRRKGARWFQVSAAATMGEAAVLLHRRGRELGISDRNQMLTAGGYPRDDGRPEEKSKR